MENAKPPERLSTKLLSEKLPTAKFELGRIMATPGALRLLESTGISQAALLARHVSGDWGDCDRHDTECNEQALLTGARIISVYRLVDDPAWLRTMSRSERQKLATVWIITEAKDENGERSCTTILRPEEY